MIRVKVSELAALNWDTFKVCVILLWMSFLSSFSHKYSWWRRGAWGQCEVPLSEHLERKSTKQMEKTVNIHYFKKYIIYMRRTVACSHTPLKFQFLKAIQDAQARMNKLKPVFPSQQLRNVNTNIQVHTNSI